MSSKPFLVISGPTASGKSRLALWLAKRLSGEIINIDSVQVYRGFDIGSAKLPVSQRDQIPHHLIDICAPTDQFHAGEFAQQAARVRAEIEERSKVPIFCGGTTMYITHLVHGLAPLPQGDEELRRELDLKSNEELHKMLGNLDQVAFAKLHQNDRIRVIRAIETSILGQGAMSDLLEKHGYSPADSQPALLLVLCWSREELYSRINRRAEEMVKDGLLEEVSNLTSVFGKDLPALKTLGYRQACQVLDEGLSQSKLANEIALHTRHFAKRQMTYFRNEPSKRGWKIRPTDLDPGVELSSEPSLVTLRDQKNFRALDLPLDEIIRQVESRLRQDFLRPEVWFLNGGDFLK